MTEDEEREFRAAVEDAFNPLALAADRLRCGRCDRAPHEIPEYQAAAGSDDREACAAYVLAEEGTLDAETFRFLCDACYIAAGQPSGPPGQRWTATPEAIIALAGREASYIAATIKDEWAVTLRIAWDGTASIEASVERDRVVNYLRQAADALEAGR